MTRLVDNDNMSQSFGQNERCFHVEVVVSVRNSSGPQEIGWVLAGRLRFSVSSTANLLKRGTPATFKRSSECRKQTRSFYKTSSTITTQHQHQPTSPSPYLGSRALPSAPHPLHSHATFLDGPPSVIKPEFLIQFPSACFLLHRNPTTRTIHLRNSPHSSM
jgi:hypothetical protein